MTWISGDPAPTRPVKGRDTAAYARALERYADDLEHMLFFLVHDYAQLPGILWQRIREILDGRV